MFARVMCPACRYQFSIPEGDMAKRHVCPNCQSPFIAGKSESEPVSSSPAPAPPPTGYAKTMLADPAAPGIKYNCPRCKAPLESPVSEAGVKKPCPACGQRLQVPNAPPPAPAAANVPNLNKTMLASDESRPPIKYNCPACKKPLEAASIEANTKKNCPSCGQRHLVPSASTTTNKTMLVTDGGPSHTPAQPTYGSGAAPGAPAAPSLATPRNIGLAVGGVAAALLLLIAVPALLRGGRHEDVAAAAKLKEDLARAQAEIEQRKKDLDGMAKWEADTRRQFDEMRATARDNEARSARRYEDLLRTTTDEAQRQRILREREEERLAREREQKEMEQKQQRLLAEAEQKRKDLENQLQQAQQRQQTIIHTPPPVYYYPPYHWRYWW